MVAIRRIRDLMRRLQRLPSLAPEGSEPRHPLAA
jgi:hypothetical protein